MPGLNLDRIAVQVEKLMLDSVVIRRENGESMNPTTMIVTKTYDEIYSGPAFAAPMGDPQGTRLGGEDVQRLQYEIGIPRSAPKIQPNDVIEFINSADDSLIEAGATLYVHDEIPTTFLSHRRLKAFKDVEST